MKKGKGSKEGLGDGGNKVPLRGKKGILGKKRCERVGNLESMYKCYREGKGGLSGKRDRKGRKMFIEENVKSGNVVKMG